MKRPRGNTEDRKETGKGCRGGKGRETGDMGKGEGEDERTHRYRE